MPEGYRQVAHIQTIKTGFWRDLTALLPGIVLIAAGCVRVRLSFGHVICALLVFAAGIYPYLALHEITHGAVYAAATGQKVKIGFTRSGAYCAMPELYVYRGVALACTAAPLAVFSVLLLALTLWLIGACHWLFLAGGMLFTLHLFSCRADVNLLRQIRRFPDKRLLVLDAGAEQRLYLPVK